jgi:phosphotransferase system  glucose/maltose/N-acetylglucosamine-specific IIC component
VKNAKDWKNWMILIVCIATLIYSIVANYAIRGNDLKHLDRKVDDVITRVERIENILLRQGE